MGTTVNDKYYYNCDDDTIDIMHYIWSISILNPNIKVYGEYVENINKFGNDKYKNKFIVSSVPLEILDLSNYHYQAIYGTVLGDKVKSISKEEYYNFVFNDLLVFDGVLQSKSLEFFALLSKTNLDSFIKASIDDRSGVVRVSSTIEFNKLRYPNFVEEFSDFAIDKDGYIGCFRNSDEILWRFEHDKFGSYCERIRYIDSSCYNKQYNIESSCKKLVK